MTDENQLQQMLNSEEYEFLMEYGICAANSELKDKFQIVQAIIRQLCIYSCQAELNQLMTGLNTLGVGNLLHKHPKSFSTLFSHKPKSMSAATRYHSDGVL